MPLGPTLYGCRALVHDLTVALPLSLCGFGGVKGFQGEGKHALFRIFDDIGGTLLTERRDVASFGAALIDDFSSLTSLFALAVIARAARAAS